MYADVGMEVWWMGGCLFQGTGRNGVWMVNDLCFFYASAMHPYIPY